jgi:hypothetical protein
MTLEQIVAILQAYRISVPITVGDQTINIKVQIADDLAQDMAKRILAETPSPE